MLDGFVDHSVGVHAENVPQQLYSLLALIFVSRSKDFVLLLDSSCTVWDVMWATILLHAPLVDHCARLGVWCLDAKLLSHMSGAIKRQWKISVFSVFGGLNVRPYVPHFTESGSDCTDMSLDVGVLVVIRAEPGPGPEVFEGPNILDSGVFTLYV